MELQAAVISAVAAGRIGPTEAAALLAAERKIGRFKAAEEKAAKARASREAWAKRNAPRNPKRAADVLGVPWPCDRETINAAYRQKAKEHHPDHGGNPDLFKAVQSAWETLSAAAA